jgi:hypothetical protein
MTTTRPRGTGKELSDEQIVLVRMRSLRWKDTDGTDAGTTGTTVRLLAGRQKRKIKKKKTVKIHLRDTNHMGFARCCCYCSPGCHSGKRPPTRLIRWRTCVHYTMNTMRISIYLSFAARACVYAWMCVSTCVCVCVCVYIRRYITVIIRPFSPPIPTQDFCARNFSTTVQRYRILYRIQ